MPTPQGPTIQKLSSDKVEILGHMCIPVHS